MTRVALKFFDGFDNYSSIGDFTNRGGGNFVIFSGGFSTMRPGRNNYGGGIQGGFLAHFQSPMTTIYAGVAWATGTGAGLGISPAMQGTSQELIHANLQFNTNRDRLELYDGLGNLVAATSDNYWNPHSYGFFELGVFIDPTNGWIEGRINGTSALRVTGIRTQSNGAGSLNSAQYLRLDSTLAPFDDFYLCDDAVGPGSFPCDSFLGDLRTYTLYAIGTDQAQWTPGTLPMGNQGQDGVLAIAANTVVTTQALTPAETGNLSKITVDFQPGFTGNARGGLYQVTSAGHGTLLATTNAVTNPAGGFVDFTFASPPGVTAGTSYYLAVQTDTAYQALFTQGGGTNYAQSSAYSGGLPASLSASSTGTQPITGAATILPAFQNWQQVDERQMDGDLTMNFSATPGQEDRFNFMALQSTLDFMVGVQPVGAYRKDDAGPRVIKNVLKSASTEVLGSTFSVPDSYQFRGDIFPVDPNTGASWTIAAINALKAGYNLVS